METDETLKEKIETEIASIPKSGYLRPGMSFNDFSKEFSQSIAQAKADKTDLERAGLDYTKMPYFEGLYEILTMEHAIRVNAEADLSDNKSEFSKAMPGARNDKALLMAAARFVVNRADSPEAKRVYKLVRKGNGDVDTLNDNIALVGFLRRFAELAAKVKPGGETLDEGRLKKIADESIRLLKLRGDAAVSSAATSAAVDRQQRIITLCMRARNEIKLFAEMAFYNDIERYNRDYASQARRTSAKTTESVDPEETFEIDTPEADKAVG